jgi:asparagine synthase (glutamine-hydrolysing)
LFASELTALVHGTRDNVIDTTALGSYLTFGYVLHPRSIYVGTKKLLPGCCGTLDLASRHLKTRRYWDLPSEETHAGGGRRDMDWLASVEETLTESVRLRLRSDVPLGAFVSGGIDSAIVAKKVREILGEGPRFELFGADFLGVRGGQAKYMRKVADAYGHQMTNLMVGEEGAVKLGEIMDVLDEPFDGGSAVAVLQLFREAQGRCKVMLTGDGGDELFAGYDLYARFSKLNRWLRMLRRVGPARAGLSAVLRGRPGRVGRLGSFMDESRIGTYVAMVSDFNLLRMLKGGEEDENLREDVGEWARAAEAKGFGDIKMAQYLDFMTTLPGRMLYKVDRFSMHYSIEARVPLLDPDLAKLAFTIPTGVNVTNGGGKAVLKRMLQDDLGADFTERKKEGFGNPLDVWVKGPEAEEAIEVMADRRSRIYEYLDYEIAVESFPQIVSREWKGREQMLWRLVVLQMFLERHGSEIARVA